MLLDRGGHGVGLTTHSLAQHEEEAGPTDSTVNYNHTAALVPRPRISHRRQRDASSAKTAMTQPLFLPHLARPRAHRSATATGALPFTTTTGTLPSAITTGYTVLKFLTQLMPVGITLVSTEAIVAWPN